MLGWSNMLLASSAGTAQGFAALSNIVVVFSTVLVVALVVLLAFLGRRGTGLVPSGWGAAFEHVYDFVGGLANDMIGREGHRYVPFAMSIFLFVLICNWSSLIPMPKFSHEFYANLGLTEHAAEPAATGAVVGEVPFEAPSVSFNTTLALAVVSFLSFNYYGLRRQISGSPARQGASCQGEHDIPGHGLFKGFFVWLAHFLSPTQLLWKELTGALRYLLVPLLGCLFVMLNIVEELARLVSLSIRLYGNLFGEHQVKGRLMENLQVFLGQAHASLSDGSVGGMLGYGLMGLLLWGSSFFVTCIGTLAGFIQAFIFFVLTLSYISHVCGDEH